MSTSTGRQVHPVSDDSHRPIIFIGPFEHHSNILPWREADVDFVQLGVNAAGGLDLDELRSLLRRFKSRFFPFFLADSQSAAPRIAVTRQQRDGPGHGDVPGEPAGA